MSAENTGEHRVVEHLNAHALLEKYPGRIPIILSRHKSCTPDITVNRCRFIVPSDLLFCNFMVFVRRRIKITSTQSIFMFCDKDLLMHSDTIQQIYNRYKSGDMFLYITYSTENAFG